MFVSKPGVALVGRMGPGMRERPLADPDGPQGEDGHYLRQRNGKWRREKTVVMREPGGLRMGEFYDAVFEVCWPVAGAGKNEYGAWVAWKAPRGKRYVRPGVLGGMGTGMSQSAPGDERSAGVLEEADLVIGTMDDDSQWCENRPPHIHTGCFLSQNKKKPQFRCQEYRRRGRMWLPWVERASESSDEK
jgi:hypothetical protein